MVRMMGLLLIVAVKPQHLSHIREIRTTYTKTAFYGLLVRLLLFWFYFFIAGTNFMWNVLNIVYCFESFNTKPYNNCLGGKYRKIFDAISICIQISQIFGGISRKTVYYMVYYPSFFIFMISFLFRNTEELLTVCLSVCVCSCKRRCSNTFDVNVCHHFTNY